MSDVVIRAEGLGKKYIIGHETQRGRYSSLRDSIARGVKAFARKAGDLVHGRPIIQGDELEEVWALHELGFEIRSGELVGIIGRNGAGKSTLLKILSRITEPSVGRVEIKGRVASLLEVGTGFHLELSGRENIFLNGAILGMSRREISRKFDEIVDFAEIEKFLDTPVKRYSSGMYVRLAFAVAAHLEPEILIVDEVLAVGDAEFQKKCLGKLRDTSRGGRTVLFVSHNIAAVKSLTTRGIVLDAGRIAFDGSTDAAIASYARLATARTSENAAIGFGRGTHSAIRSASLVDEHLQPAAHYMPGTPFRVNVEFDTDGTRGLSLEVFLVDASRCRIGLASTVQFHGQPLPSTAGSYSCVLDLRPQFLASGEYSLDLATSVPNSNWDHQVDGAARFEVPFSNPAGHVWDFKQEYGFGSVALLLTEVVHFTRQGDQRTADGLGNS